MKKSMIWASVVGVVGAMALAGCQKHEDAAAPAPETNTTTTAPATDANGNALPSDQTDDMSNMHNGDAAKPSTLPDSQSGTAEESR